MFKSIINYWRKRSPITYCFDDCPLNTGREGVTWESPQFWQAVHKEYADIMRAALDAKV